MGATHHRVGKATVLDLNKKILFKAKGFHIAFPDTKGFCNKNLIAYRKGLTHASDKGKVILSSLSKKNIHNILEISDLNFDIRNPYLVIDKNNLYIYITKFDYKFPKTGFISSKLFQLSNGCKFFEKPSLIREIPKTLVYAPISLNQGSFGFFIKDRLWCLAIFQKQGCIFYTNDEELSILEDEVFGNFGLLRNHPRLGKELIYLEFNKYGKVTDKRNWCKNKRNSTLISPKIYKYNNKYYVAFAEREVDNNSSNIRSKVWLKIFNSKKDLKKCSYEKIYKTNSINNWDSGYPTILFEEEKSKLIWYGYDQNSSYLYISDFR